MYTSLRLSPIHLSTRGAVSILKPSSARQLRRFTAAAATQAPAAARDTLRRQPIDVPKSAVVTGSSRGIGKAIALRLAIDGYNVCINDIHANAKACDEVVREIQGMGRKACTATADVSKRAEVKNMIQKSVKELGPLHTMVANAGIAQVRQILEITDEDFQRMMNVNVVGVHNCYLEAARQMIEQGTCKPDSPGKLLAAASIVAFKPMPMLGHYSASKWAVRGLTQVYAMNLAKHHITVNAYAPGIVGTPMWDQLDADMAAQRQEAAGGKLDIKKGDVMQEFVTRSTLLQRASVPEDVAKLVSFLASSDSDFVTGQTQVVDGGIVFT